MPAVKEKKLQPIKGMMITHNGVTYDKITDVCRNYDYSWFSYLDDKGNECRASFDGTNNAFSIVTDS